MKKIIYWLRADPSVDSGEIEVMAGDENTIVITPKNVNGDFSILIHPAMLDVSRPIRLLTPKGEFQVVVHPSEDILRFHTRNWRPKTGLGSGDPLQPAHRCRYSRVCRRIKKYLKAVTQYKIDDSMM